MKIQRLAILFLILLLIGKSLYCQNEEAPLQEEIPLTSFDVIQRQGKRIPLTARERAEIQSIIRDLMEDFIATLTLSTLEKRTDYSGDGAKYNIVPRSIGDPDTKIKLLSLFPEQLWDQPILYNFFQPGKKAADHYTPEMISPRAYTDSLEQWFQGVDIIIRQRPVIVSDFYYKYPKRIFSKSNNYINVRLPIRSTGTCDDRSRIFELCENGRIVQNVDLSVVIELSDQTLQLETGEEIPLTYKIRYVEKIDPIGERDHELQFRNWWAFSGIHFSSGITGADATAETAYPGIQVSAGHSLGALGKFALYFTDTLSLLGKKKLWDFGADIGIGITQQTYDFLINKHNESYLISQTPINNVGTLNNYNLNVTVNNLNQNASLTFINLPISLVFKRYFSHNRINSALIEVGAAYNMLLSQTIKQQSGTITYVGEGMQFAPGFDPITVSDLPHYGFGTFNAHIKDDLLDPFNSYYLSAHIRAGFSYRKSKFSRIRYMITPWFNFGLTDLRANNGYTNPIYNIGEIDNQAVALTSFRPYSFGIDIGISYNTMLNKLRNIRSN